MNISQAASPGTGNPIPYGRGNRDNCSLASFQNLQIFCKIKVRERNHEAERRKRVTSGLRKEGCKKQKGGISDGSQLL